MIDVDELKRELNRFHGTERYYLSSYFGDFLWTDGVHYLAENADAWWLVDAIQTYIPDMRKHRFQVWELKVNSDKTALLKCTVGANVVVQQEIQYTDFPLEQIKLFLEYGSVGRMPSWVLMLPSER